MLARPGYTQLAVSVTDPSGAPLDGLKKSDFTVRSGANSDRIVYFRQESSVATPVSLVIVGDVSESMALKTTVISPDDLQKARTRLNQAEEQLSRCDEVALVMIGGRYLSGNEPPLGPVTLAQSFTTDQSLALERMYSVIPSGEKRLSDGIRMGLETLSGAHYPNRALVLMTDGLDQAVIDQSAPALAQIRESGISFWVIGIGDPHAQESILTKLRGTTRLDADAVKKLAADGGGWALFAKPVASDQGVSLAEVVTTINQELGSDYVLGIDQSPPGKTAPTVTLANNSSAVVRADVVPSAVLATAASRPAEPQREVGTGKEIVAPEAIRNLPGYTEIAATVTQPDRSYVDGLSKSNFRLSLKGTPQPINFFRAGQDSPATVGILVDTSGSMTPKLPQARAAIEQFVRALDPQDEVFLFAFSSHPFELQPPTTDHNAVIKRLSLLRPYGQTALFDTIGEGISAAQRSQNRRKVLLVITDGIDNVSSFTAEDVVRAARSSGVLVYSIGIGDPNMPRGGSVVVGPFLVGGDDIEHVDAVTLSRLASANGSKSYIIQSVGDGAALKKACEEIASDLHDRHSYAIGFVAHVPADYAPTTIPIALQVSGHTDYVVETPKWIPAPPATETASTTSLNK